MEDCLDIILLNARHICVRDLCNLSCVSKTSHELIYQFWKYRKTHHIRKKCIPNVDLQIMFYGGKCVMCGMFTKIRCSLYEATPFICIECIRQRCIDMDTAKKKWRISDTDISKIMGVKICDKVYFDKLTLRNMAHDAFGGPKHLLIAIKGKARYAREKHIQQLLPFVSRNHEFRKQALSSHTY